MSRTTFITTTWEVITYDVLGNHKDGYQVNESRCEEEVTIRLRVETNNVDTPHAFLSAYPTDRDIRKVFDTRCAIDTDGDDMVVYVTRRRDGYPLGELRCVSHASLSPIRERISS